MTVNALKHQSAYVNMVRMHPEIPYTFLIGGFGCLAENPITRSDGKIDTRNGLRTASEPVPCTSHLVDLEWGGQQIRMSDAHQLLTSSGWIPVRSLGLRIGFARLLSELDVRRYCETLLSFLYDYLKCFDYDDEQLHCLLGSDLGELPSLEYAQEHNRVYLESGDYEILLASIQLGRDAVQVLDWTRHHEANLDPTLHSADPCCLPSLDVLADGVDLSCSEPFGSGLLAAVQYHQYVLRHLPEFLRDNAIRFCTPYRTSYPEIITDCGVRVHDFKVRYSGKGTVYKLTVDGGEYNYKGLVHHNCGKSFSDVLLLTYLTQEYRYCTEPITFGLIGVTIKLLKQTVIADFERWLDQCGIPYKDNTQAGTIAIGHLTFVYLPMQDPDDIYAHNFHGALVDEIDEVVTEKVKPIVTAIQERSRKIIPAGKTMPSRKPFICFSTTAQGLGGTYQLVKSFDKANLDARAMGKKPPLPYAIIRGRTEDNPNIDPDQVTRLRALYTPEEAAAYLDGKFMNLAIGRVWYSFDRRKHVCMRFPVQPDEHIFWGQDFNLGINACALMVVRGDVIYTFASYHWKDMAEGADTLREMYPTNHITMIPDASGKEIMQGFAAKFDEKNIEIVWNAKNPGIHERVMAGNILFRTGKLFVMEDDGQHGDVDNAILALEGHDVDEKTGKPRKGTGIHSPDHFSDSFSYAVWRIIHTIKGYDDVLNALKPSHVLY